MGGSWRDLIMVHLSLVDPVMMHLPSLYHMSLMRFSLCGSTQGLRVSSSCFSSPLAIVTACTNTSSSSTMTFSLSRVP